MEELGQQLREREKRLAQLQEQEKALTAQVLERVSENKFKDFLLKASHILPTTLPSTLFTMCTLHYVHSSLCALFFTMYTLHYVYVQVFRKKIKRAKPKAEGGKKKGDGEGGAVEEEDEDSGQESDSDFLRFVAL